MRHMKGGFKMAKVFKRIKKCGDIVGVYDYEKGYFKNYSSVSGLKKGDDGFYYNVNTGERVLIGRQNQGLVSEEDRKKIRVRNFFKAKNRIRDLVNTNVYSWGSSRPKFLTLTFKSDVSDLRMANDEFKKFIKRLNYYIVSNIDNEFVGLKYVAVPEIQEKRAKKYNVSVWHYHILFFNLPFVKWDIIHKVWGLGSTYIEGFEDVSNRKNKIRYSDKNKCLVNGRTQIRNVGAYITKTMEYMAKNLNDDRLVGQKCYFVSKGLKEPDIFEFGEIIDLGQKKETMLAHNLSCENIVFANVFENEHIGKCVYREYNTRFSFGSTSFSLRMILECLRNIWGVSDTDMIINC